MDDSAPLFFFGLFIGIIVSVFIHSMIQKEWRADMIKHKCGYYDSTTSEFKMKDVE